VQDQIEILMQEVALLRQEVAHILALVGKSADTSQVFHAAVLERIDSLATQLGAMEVRLPPLPQ